MKQIIQNLRSGETLLEDIPVPQVSRGAVLIKTTRTLVSLGTERMLVEFSKANLVQKARQQPEKVKMVLDKVRSEGLMPTLESVFNKLDQPLRLGYCNVGRVVAVGEGVVDFKVGDRVASNGQHAEYTCIPQNLVAHIPDAVSDDEAAFTVVGSIGLQGIRLLNPTFGETVVVIGLGLIGLITAELLVANGCQVIGVDPDESKLKMAAEKGIRTINPAGDNDPVKLITSLTQGIGADGVIIAASSKSSDIIRQAAQMSRKRGRIVLVGVIGLDINRADLYEKELTFQVSCSYGPGRYDEAYEQKGQDYPLAFVRWTEKRNFEAILSALASRRLDVKPLITELVPLSEYQQIYGNMGKSNKIASILVYPESAETSPVVQLSTHKGTEKKGIIGIIGAGNFTKAALIPSLKKLNADMRFIASNTGVSGTMMAKKSGISKSTTDYREILNDQEIDTVFITTRPFQHAPMTISALKAGKHVFVEKPLAITSEELEEVIAAYQQSNGLQLMVGFNRRFSPHVIKMKSLLDPAAPKNIIATMNAGFIPYNLWFHDMSIGGGRFISEACHHIDLVAHLSGSLVESVCMTALGAHPQENTDNASIMLKFKNGDLGIINYFSNGHKAYSKERVEVFSQEKTMILDNFMRLEAYGYKGFSSMKTKLDKGHHEQFSRFLQSIRTGGESLIPFESLVNTTRTTFAAITSLKTGQWVTVGSDEPQ
jgi:predicted dehydrogenase/threonine dehydrogenase-like Zn-dependent dehydrogenase